jgi:hypothetical protein
MCDYSLAGLRNRLAVTGEKLLVHRFPSGSLGLVSIRRRLREFLFPGMTVAVCVPPGARLLLEGTPECVRLAAGVSEREEVTFTQLNMAAWARDGVRFANGTEVLLQSLEPGQKVTVLNVESDDEKLAPADEVEMRAG